MRRISRSNVNHERGAALPTVLVVLFILTVLGMLALTTAGIEVRLAGNEREYQRALYVAEAGLARMRATVPLVPSTTSSSSFAFNISDPSISGGITGDLNGCTYNVVILDNNDGDPTNDADGKINVRATATSPQGTRASIEMPLKAESFEQKTLSDYGDGTKDTSPVSITNNPQNFGPL